MNKLIVLFAAIMLVFSTSVDAQTTVLTQDFESGNPPAGWTVDANSPSKGFEFGVSSALSSAYYSVPSGSRMAASNDDRWDNNSATQNVADRDRLISPSMDLSSYTSLVLAFETYNPEEFGSNGTVEISTDGGSTWLILFDIPATISWEDIRIDLSGYAGAGNTDIKIAFRHNDGNGWASGVAIDNFSVYVPQNLDLGLEVLSMPSVSTLGELPIKGTVVNNGLNNVTSFDVTYSVDGGVTTQTETISGIFLALNDSYDFTTSMKWTADVLGVSTVDVTISNVNGTGADMNAANDMLSTDVDVLEKVATLTPLVESATNTSCGPCVSGNANLHNILPAMIDNSTMAHISYHWDFPGPSDEFWLYNVPENRYRIENIYGINGVPSARLNGNFWSDHSATLTVGDIEESRNEISPFRLTVRESQNADSAFFDITIEAFADVNVNDLAFQLVVMEDHIGPLSPRPNSETDFYQVMRDMIPTHLGTNIGAQTRGDVTDLMFAYEYDDATTELSQLRTVLFIQDPSTLKVYQALQTLMPTGTTPTKYNSLETGAIPGSITLGDGDDFDVSSGTTITYNGNDYTINDGDTIEVNGVIIVVRNGVDITITEGDNVNFDPNGGGEDIYFESGITVSTDASANLTVGGGVGIDDKDAFEQFSAFPNPASDVLNVTYTTTEADDITVNLTNALGQIVKAYQITDAVSGTNNFSIDLTAFQSGVYILNVESTNFKTSERVVIAH